MFRVKWVVLWSLWATSVVRQPTAPVRVSGGWVRGVVSRDGSFIRYLGLPYATIDREHRFQPPQPEPSWEGVKDVVEENVRCPQRYIGSVISGREDCLTLNVYTPLKQSSTLLPVMVFIHGGGFRDGSSSPFLYGPQYLIRHGVVLVTFNYRLEILGFLCLGIKEAPGNAGLRDQVQALKWVKRNIRVFGGDPDNVTLFGESAGSASVMYHILSPMSTGLFHKAIMQSGSAMSPWSLQFEPVRIASLLAKQMGHITENPKELYAIFINKTAEKLLKTRIPRADGDLVLSENIFVPCIEKKVLGVVPFLSDHPYNLMLKGKYNKVPIIIGHNSAEGLMFAGKENETTISKIDFYNAIPRDLLIPTKEEKIKIAGKLKNLYMNDKEVSKKTLVKLAKYEGDIGITYPVISTTELFIKTSDYPVFSYKFCYDGLLNIAKQFYGFRKEQGATHADELFYIFKLKLPLPQALLENEIINKITTMWTNFAKFTDPTPEKSPSTKWLPADASKQHSFVIDKEFSSVPLWDDETLVYLNTTYTKYRRIK